MTWRKSSHSGSYDGACLEADGPWRKATYSNSFSNCVQAQYRGTVRVRDSRLGDASPVLEFTPAQWVAFTARVKAGGAA